MKRLAAETAQGSGLGLLFAVAELIRLKAGGLELEPRRLLPVLVGYALLGGTIALATAAVCALARRRAGEGRLADLLDWLPQAAVLFVFSATIVNGLWLGRRTSAPSLLADLALLILSIAAVAAARRFISRPLPVLACATAALLGVLVWLLLPRSGPGARASGGGVARPNLVFVLIDTLRADHLGLYGYERSTSPFLDELAGEGVVFEHAYSTTNWTRPAVASIFTSTMPSRHGAVEQHLAPSPESPLLAEELQKAGYRTGFFTAGVNVEASDGYGRGADHFHSAYSRDVMELTVVGRNWLRPLLQRWRGDEAVEQVRPSDLVDRALAWEREQPGNRPLFLYVHFHGPHTPYAPPEPWDRAFGDRPVDPRLVKPPRPWAGAEALSAEDRAQMIVQYDGEILWHDEGLARLFAGLREAGRLDDAMLVVTSDHGEGFGEHGAWGHNAALFDEMVRVPLVLWASGGRLRAGRSEAAVSLLDLAPTLLDFAGLESPPAFDGGSLLPWLRGERNEPRRVFFENPLHDEMGVRTEEWVYFEGRVGDESRRWLYRADDAAQTRSLAESYPEVVERLSRLVAQRRETDRQLALPGVDVELDEDRVRELKDLGYLQ